MTLPNFIIGGVPKGGTTSLDYYLAQHPEVYMAPKEPRYFMFDPEDLNPLSDYSHVPIRSAKDYESLFAGVNTEKAIGETSPFYMMSPVAIKRIPNELPQVKLIFTLREPIARAYSAYWMQVRQGRESRPVEVALSEGTFYINIGCYSRFLDLWFDKFQASQIKILLFDDLKKDPIDVYSDICNFLGISDDFIPDLGILNRGSMPKSIALTRLNAMARSNKLIMSTFAHLPPGLQTRVISTRDKNLQDIPPIPEDIVGRLSVFYRDEISRLEEMLGRDLSAWRRG